MARRNCCNGDCCRRFTIPYSPDEIAENYRAWQACELNGDQGEDRLGHRIVEEIWLIAPMLRYIGERNTTPAGKKLDSPCHWYTCVHFDGKDCGIYKIRPKMCRDYPYGRKCQYPGCRHTNRKRREARCVG